MISFWDKIQRQGWWKLLLSIILTTVVSGLLFIFIGGGRAILVSLIVAVVPLILTLNYSFLKNILREPVIIKLTATKCYGLFVLSSMLYVSVFTLVITGLGLLTFNLEFALPLLAFVLNLFSYLLIISLFGIMLFILCHHFLPTLVLPEIFLILELLQWSSGNDVRYSSVFFLDFNLRAGFAIDQWQLMANSMFYLLISLVLTYLLLLFFRDRDILLVGNSNES